MTRITKVEVRGFKSFANKTEIIFGNRYNCVIGANGSGKSNVSDMICFVLGRTSAKSMRAEKSANLIYNGGKKGDPSKEAAVSIFFDNAKKIFPLNEKEVNITRRVNQKGISSYILNGRNVTRQEILDVLNIAKIDPDGHNIVSQGDIVQFTEMKPVERRELLEGISGISMYEDKKQKALLELDKVDVRLNEVSIILKEREQYLGSLKKDRDQALEYKELEGDIVRNKATLMHLRINDMEEKNRDVSSKIKKYTDTIEGIKKLLVELQQKTQEKKDLIGELDKNIKTVGEDTGKDVAVTIDMLKADVVRFESRIEVCNNEITKMQTKKDELKRNVKETETKILEITGEIKKLQDELQGMKKEDESLLKSLEQTKVKHDIDDVGQINKELNQLDTLIQQREKEQQGFTTKKNVDALEKELDGVLKNLSKTTNENLELSKEMTALKEKLFEKNAELEKEKMMAGSSHERMITDITLTKFLGVKHPGVHGVVMDLGKVDTKYASALNVAAGGRLKNIVVESDDIAKNCIEYLKANKLGVLTFLPLNKLKVGVHLDVAKSFLKEEGVIDLAVNLVSYDKKFQDVFSYVFGSTLVVKDLVVARRIGIGRVRMITLDGDLVETSGAMIGGYRGKGLGYGFKEQEVKVSLLKLEKELSLLKDKNADLEKQKKGVEEEIFKLREKRALFEDKISIFKKEIMETGLPADGAKLAAELPSLKKKRDELKMKFDALMSQGGNVQLNDIEAKRFKGKEKMANSEAMMASKKNEIAHIYLKEKEKLLQLIKETESEQQAFEQELTDVQKKLNDKRKELKEKDKEQKAFYGHYKELFEKKNKIVEAIQELEMKHVRHEEKINILNDKLHFTNQDKEKIETELIALTQEFEAFKEVKLKKGISVNELNDQIRDFERMQKQMGNVNMKALEIYEKIEEEYNAILSKVEKLRQEKDDVLNMINEIEASKKDLFMKTFQVINDHFKNIFSMISTKGAAYMDIEDQENIFNGGVDIKVKITSKKYLDINSLSGGEKTLAALAFIFAIQEHQPAPFYLLDEVDAALDKNNSELLSRLLAKYSDTAQYIVISHNDAVISNADQIYGVSMQDGVSKIVSLKV